MTVDRKTAKTLCSDDEFELFELSQPAKMKTLSAVELQDLVRRSRVLRDKWRDVSRKQRRSSQSSQGARQTADNARSEDKAALFAEVHQRFASRQEAVKSGELDVPAGAQPIDVPRKDRRIVNRAVRSIVQGELDKTKRRINRASKSAERATRKTTKAGKSTKKASASATSKASTANQSSAKAKVESAAIKPAVTKSAGAKAAVTAGKRSTVKAAAKGKATKAKLPKVSKARVKARSLRAKLTSAVPPQDASPTEEPKRSPPSKAISKSAIASRNRPIHAKASVERVARGGGTRMKGHVSAAGKRAQGRRDSKG